MKKRLVCCVAVIFMTVVLVAVDVAAGFTITISAVGNISVTVEGDACPTGSAVRVYDTNNNAYLVSTNSRLKKGQVIEIQSIEKCRLKHGGNDTIYARVDWQQ